MCDDWIFETIRIIIPAKKTKTNIDTKNDGLDGPPASNMASFWVASWQISGGVLTKTGPPNLLKTGWPFFVGDEGVKLIIPGFRTHSDSFRIRFGARQLKVEGLNHMEIHEDIRYHVPLRIQSPPDLIRRMMVETLFFP